MINEIIKNQQKYLKRGGALRDKSSKKDYRAEEILAGVEIKRPSFEEGYSVIKNVWADMPVKDQGATFSCVGQAWSYYKQILQKLDTSEETELSAFSIYNPIAIPGTGSYIRDGGMRTVNYGVNKEATLRSPLDESTMTRKFDFGPYENEAAFYNNRVIAKIDTQDFNKLADMIFLNHGIVSGWGAHCVYFGEYGILNGKRFIKTPNSYGEGQDLYYFEKSGQGSLFSIWTAIDIKNFVEIPKNIELLYADLKLGDSGNEVLKLKSALTKLGLITSDNGSTYDSSLAR